MFNLQHLNNLTEEALANFIAANKRSQSSNLVTKQKLNQDSDTDSFHTTKSTEIAMRFDA